LIAFIEHVPVLRDCIALIKMSALYLRIEDPDDPLANKTLRILQGFLQPSSRLTIKDTAQSILALLTKDAPVSTEVWDFGETCIEIAEQIPYHHPSQIKLAALFEELGKSSKFGSPQSSEVFTSYTSLFEPFTNTKAPRARFQVNTISFSVWGNH